MDNWKKRWEKFMFTEDMVVGGNTVLNPKPETYSDFVRMLDDIGKFISQELDKAREEELQRVYDFVEKESGKSGRKEILEYIEELSKLKQ